MIDVDTLSYLQLIKAEISSCGSRVTCNPPPTDTDADYLVIIDIDEAPSLMGALSSLGWSWEGSNEHYQNQLNDGFSSFRKKDVNLLVTASPEWSKRHKAATHVCTRLNLMNKDDRIALFQAVLYGALWDGRK